jgi:rhomboid protease GluP
MNEDRPRSPEIPPPAYPEATGAPARVAVRRPNVRPIVTYSLLGFTIFVYILQEASGYLTGRDLPALYGMKINELIIAGQYWRLITPMFLHGSLLHIAFNMYALYIFGPQLESFFGHGRFTALYFFSGISGNLVSFLFSPAPSLGSSTAIFGLLGAEGVFLYQNRKLLGGVAQRALAQIVSIALFNLLIGLSPGIDNWGHVGGLIGGTLFTWLAGPILAVEGVYPDLSIVDRREPVTVFQATAAFGLVLVLLAVASIYIKSGGLS